MVPTIKVNMAQLVVAATISECKDQLFICVWNSRTIKETEAFHVIPATQKPMSMENKALVTPSKNGTTNKQLRG